MPKKALRDAVEREDGVGHRRASPREQARAQRRRARAAARMIAALDHVDVEGREAHVVERVAKAARRRRTPTKVQVTLPLPPARLVPPMTVAPMMSRSAEPPPMVGRPPSQTRRVDDRGDGGAEARRRQKTSDDDALDRHAGDLRRPGVGADRRRYSGRRPCGCRITCATTASASAISIG